MEETKLKTKYCKFCGERIPEDAIICTNCGRQVEQIKAEQPQVIINNTNSNVNKNINTGRGNEKNKWIALALCIFLGYVGAHKFYEGKSGTGIIYVFTMGLFGIGWIVDIISLAFKSNPYYV